LACRTAFHDTSNYFASLRETIKQVLGLSTKKLCDNSEIPELNRYSLSWLPHCRDQFIGHDCLITYPVLRLQACRSCRVACMERITTWVSVRVPESRPGLKSIDLRHGNIENHYIRAERFRHAIACVPSSASPRHPNHGTFEQFYNALPNKMMILTTTTRIIIMPHNHFCRI